MKLTNSSTETLTLIYEDDQFAIAMTKDPQFHGQPKYIEINLFKN